MGPPPTQTELQCSLKEAKKTILRIHQFQRQPREPGLDRSPGGGRREERGGV